MAHDLLMRDGREGKDVLDVPMTVETDTSTANGSNIRPECNASAPETPWNSCGSKKLAGRKAVAWNMEPMRNKRVVRFRNSLYPVSLSMPTYTRTQRSLPDCIACPLD
jgi:hypothetical protein